MAAEMAVSFSPCCSGGLFTPTHLLLPRLQLVEKQRLIEQLQAELARLSSGGSIRDDNLAAQEAVIRLLKEQSEAEMGARTTAQKALSEKAQALDKCLVQQHELAWEVQQCRAGVDQAHGGSYR